MGLLTTAKNEILATIGLGPSPTVIRNNSDRSIALIPISCAHNANNPLLNGSIEYKLVRLIKKKSTERVFWWKYRPSFRGVTKIVFREAGKNDSRTKYLQELTASAGSPIKLSKGETLHDDTILCENLVLDYKPEENVIEMEKTGQDGKTTQIEGAEETSQSSGNKPQSGIPSELTKEVKKLQEEVEVLKFHMATLVDILK